MRHTIATIVALSTATGLFAGSDVLAKRDELRSKLDFLGRRKKVLVLPFTDKTGGKADLAGIRAGVEALFKDSDYDVVAATDATAAGPDDEAAVAAIAEKAGVETVVGGAVTRYESHKHFNAATFLLPGGGVTSKARVGLDVWAYRRSEGKVAWRSQGERQSSAHMFSGFESKSHRRSEASQGAIDKVFAPYFEKYPALALNRAAATESR